MPSSSILRLWLRLKTWKPPLSVNRGRSQDQQVFLWLAVVAASAVFLVPFAVLYAPIAGAAWGYILLSAGLEAIYFTLLGQAYRRGDLSLAYPVIRGTGILTATLVAYL